MWQPIETAPKDGTKILVFTIHGDVEISEWYDLKHDEYDQVEGDLYRKRVATYAKGWNGNHPTHWMPLPSAPTDAEEVAARFRAEWRKSDL